MWKSKKRIENKIGQIELDYRDYLLKKKDFLLYEKKIKEYRNDFRVRREGTKMINRTDFAMNALLMSEVINFYNNDKIK